MKRYILIVIVVAITVAAIYFFVYGKQHNKCIVDRVGDCGLIR